MLAFRFAVFFEFWYKTRSFVFIFENGTKIGEFCKNFPTLDKRLLRKYKKMDFIHEGGSGLFFF